MTPRRTSTLPVLNVHVSPQRLIRYIVRNLSNPRMHGTEWKCCEKRQGDFGEVSNTDNRTVGNIYWRYSRIPTNNHRTL